jgi:membrane associated rhomboid family serine protease
VGLLLALTALLSLVAAVGDRHLGNIYQLIQLHPKSVWQGQAWRLFTWPYVEPGAWGLIFTCLSLYWFGPSLASQWGSPRFLRVMVGLMLVAGGGTCLVALVDREVMEQSYQGSWAMITGLIVMWGLTYRDVTVRIYFVLPIRGFWMAWGTVAITVVYAAYSGWLHLVPELFAELAALAWIYQKLLIARWSKARSNLEARRRAARRSAEARKRGGVVVDLRTGEPTNRDNLN